MPKKLMPNNGAKKMPIKTGGTNKPMAGGGSRGTGKLKLNPNNGAERTWKRESLAGTARDAKSGSGPGAKGQNARFAPMTAAKGKKTSTSSGGGLKPMSGKGSRGQGKKLKPNNMSKRMPITTGGSNTPMKGNRGPKKTG